MNTAELIEILAADSPPARASAPARWLAAAALLGAALGFALLIPWLGLRPLGEAAQSGSFWMKAAYSLSLAGAGGAIAARLARPDGRTRAAPMAIGVIVALMAGLAALTLARAAPGTKGALWLGDTWRMCPWRILLLAAPTYLAAIAILRRMAPTRLALAGAAAGLLAGGVGATVYGFYCQEWAAPFVAVWYSLGIAASAAFGALLGRWILRW